jgi:glycosyltransferase involved in cell wall biosynthesis
VLHVITRLIRGGAQENTLLTVGLTDRDRFEVHLAGGPEGEWLSRGRMAADRFHVIAALGNPISPRRDLAAFAQLLRLMRRERFAVVHTHTSKAGVLGRLAARLAGVPAIVHTPHGTVLHDVYFTPRQQRLVAWVKRTAARFSDAIITMSDCERDLYVARRIAPSNRFRTIYSGIDYSRFEDSPGGRDQVRRSLGLGEHDLMVFFPARYVPEKGHRFFFAAAEQVMRTMPEVQVFLAGDGPLAQEVAALHAASAFPDRVHALGFRRDVLELMSAAEVVVSASLSEGLPRTMVEALLLERPVAATDAGGTREVVLDKVTGMLVPCGDGGALAEAILYLLRHPEEAARMGAAGLERVRPLFDARAMVRRIEDLYQECLGGEGPPIEHRRPFDRLRVTPTGVEGHPERSRGAAVRS